MKQVLVAVFCFAPFGVAAEEAPSEEGFSLMERGAQMFFQGLLDEVEPAIDEMQSFAQDIGPGMAEMLSEMGPAFRELIGRVDDMSNYEPPVMLPNGDIILRRKQDAPELPEVGPNGEVDL